MQLKVSLIVIISILILVILEMGSLLKDANDDADRWENNASEVQKNISRVELELGEFKKYLTHREDSILKVLNIKPKQVLNYTTVNTYYTDTTISTPGLTLLPDSSYSFEDNIGCISIKGITKIVDNKPIVSFTEKTFNDTIQLIDYTERKQWKVWFIKSRLFGKKEIKQQAFSECGEITVKKVVINK